MTIPDEEHFHLFINLTGARPCDEVPMPRRKSLQPVEDSQSYFSACFDAIEAHRARIRHLQLWKWLDSQGSFHRAMKAVVRQGGHDPMQSTDLGSRLATHRTRVVELVSDHVYLNMKVKRNARWPDECLTPDERFWRYLQMHGKSLRPFRLYADIATALHWYFYGSAPHGNAHSEQLSATAKAIQAAASILEEEVAPVCQVMPYPSTAASRLKAILTKLNALELELRRDQQRAYPTTRDDQTAGERRLVWDLRTAFRKAFGADKPAAIFYMMQLDGINRPPDKRSIERSLFEWRNRGKQPTPAEAV